MNKKEHIKRHKKLHKMLDELAADYVCLTGNLLSEITLVEFLAWSHWQTIEPDIALPVYHWRSK